jgi:hypothetical protein
MKKLMMISALLSGWIGCTHFGTSDETHTVSGIVENKNGPLAGATVTIDNSSGLSNSTDQNGHYQIDKVPKGSHAITARYTLVGGAFVQTVDTVDLVSDTVLTPMVLPNPVTLYTDYSASETSLTMRWTPTTAIDFREYKVYALDMPGLDENTGSLVYVSVNPLDTVFTHTNLLSSKTYYYRVYLMNSYGRMGGSNLLGAKTLSMNLIGNGGFETYDSLSLSMPHWTMLWDFGTAETLDTTVKKEGRQSLRIRTDLLPGGQCWFRNRIDGINKKQTYVFRFWLKTDSIPAGITVGIGPEDPTGISYPNGYVTCPNTKSDWKEYGFDVSFTNSNDPAPIYLFVFPSKSDSVGLYWLDKISLLPKQ